MVSVPSQSHTTIPFASFCWFSRDDNIKLNEFSNSLNDVYEYCNHKGVNIYCIPPPSEMIPLNSIIRESSSLPPDLPLVHMPSRCEREESVGSDLLLLAINTRLNSLLTWSNSFLAFFTNPPLYIYVVDLEVWISVDLIRKKASLVTTDSDLFFMPYMQVISQPLHFAFANSFGIQTLGVSGRYEFRNCSKVPNSWILLRILSSLDNGGTPLRFTTLLKPALYLVIRDRQVTLLRQIYAQIVRFIRLT